MGLDDIEVEVKRPVGVPWAPKPEWRYSMLDMPAFFVELQVLTDRRARWD
jgi:hypothetical protein